MKPIVPVKQITLAVIRAESIIPKTRTSSTLTPRLIAVSSPAPRVLMSQESLIKIKEQATVTRAIIATLSQEERPREPIIQKTTS